MFEKLINQIDEYVVFENKDKDGNTTNKVNMGLTIHYSPTNDYWSAYYGYRPNGKRFKGMGETPSEALQDLINKQAKNSRRL